MVLRIFLVITILAFLLEAIVGGNGIFFTPTQYKHIFFASVCGAFLGFLFDVLKINSVRFNSEWFWELKTLRIQMGIIFTLVGAALYVVSFALPAYKSVSGGMSSSGIIFGYHAYLDPFFGYIFEDGFGRKLTCSIAILYNLLIPYIVWLILMRRARPPILVMLVFFLTTLFLAGEVHSVPPGFRHVSQYLLGAKLWNLSGWILLTGMLIIPTREKNLPNN